MWPLSATALAIEATGCLLKEYNSENFDYFPVFIWNKFPISKFLKEKNDFNNSPDNEYIPSWNQNMLIKYAKNANNAICNQRISKNLGWLKMC